MTMYSVRLRNFVRSTTMVVCIVDFVDWLVMAIGEDGRFAFMRVHIVDTMLNRLPGEDGRVDDMRKVLGN